MFLPIAIRFNISYPQKLGFFCVKKRLGYFKAFYHVVISFCSTFSTQLISLNVTIRPPNQRTLVVQIAGSTLFSFYKLEQHRKNSCRIILLHTKHEISQEIYPIYCTFLYYQVPGAALEGAKRTRGPGEEP